MLYSIEAGSTSALRNSGVIPTFYLQLTRVPHFLPVAASLIVLPALAQLSVAAELNRTNKAFHRSRASIQIPDLQRHASTLANDAMEGRESGSAGGRAAATYIMRSLQRMDLKPAGVSGTYGQPFRSGFRNILASVKGGGKLRQEVILLSAHYDHVGYGSRQNSNGAIGTIHNGADDNASGVATLLEVAEALQVYEGELNRTVLIAFWDAEEKGMWGSKHWLSDPTVPLTNVRMMVNVDMVGRLRAELMLFGTRSMPGLRHAWSRANSSTDLNLAFPWKVFDNSDHYPFLRKQIPATMLHTGLHDDYHRPSDDVELLNFDGIQKAAELVFNFAVEMANRRDFAPFRPSGLSEGELDQRRYERPSPNRLRRLGLTLREAQGGLLIRRVRPGSAAEVAGLRAGQVIVGVGDTSPVTLVELRRRVAAAAGPVQLSVTSGGLSQLFSVKVPGMPLRVGISWRTNPAEPESITISHVASGSPADKAGLRRLDRILEVNGISVATQSSSEFRHLMSSVEGSVDVLVERGGRLQLRVLQLPAVAE